MMRSWIALGLFCASLLASCSSSSTTGPTTSTVSISKQNMQPDSAQGYLYYSLDGDSVVPYAQRSTAAWDICMAYLQGEGRTRQVDVFFNSGKAGPGTTKAAVVNSRFENVATVDTTLLRTDDTTATSRIVSTDLTGPGIFVYQSSQHTIVVSPDKTILVRTHAGNYVKFQFTSIYKDAPASPTMFMPLGYYHFRYVRSTTTTF